MKNNHQCCRVCRRKQKYHVTAIERKTKGSCYRLTNYHVTVLNESVKSSRSSVLIFCRQLGRSLFRNEYFLYQTRHK